MISAPIRRTGVGTLLAALALGQAAAQPPPLLPTAQARALVNELSGETAKRNLEGLARLHRQRGSQGFHAAAQLIAERAQAYGLQDVEILSFPADGRVFYGTQRSRPAWDAEEGELSELREGVESRIASYAASPIVLAEDSESADVTAELVDAGDGTHESDYAGRDVRGKLVLVAQQPGAVQELAVGKHGAAGIVSYAQNQRTAWFGENDGLVRWGHLESFSPARTFAFMVSLRTARALEERLAAGEGVRLHARVHAGQHPGAYEVVTATIPGADPRLREREVAFSCHLDHQRPGANDNASGCVTILEAGRALASLIGAGVLPRPARTLRFFWPPEVEGTVALLNARPAQASRLVAVVHMDMVGGGAETKAVFHVTQGPRSLPSFVHDVAWAFADWINSESYDFAATGQSDYPSTAPEGGKEPLRAMYSTFTMGSDHEVYEDSSFRIPAIYLNDWPDRYIHTNADSAANIDPTKLKRAALIGAASAYFLANLTGRDRLVVERAIAAGRLEREVVALRRGAPARAGDAYERGVEASLGEFLGDPRPAARSLPHAPRRIFGPRGPMTVFGYDYLLDHAEAQGVPPPKLLQFTGAWGSGEEYAYEALNLADGSRTEGDIAAALSAEYGAVPVELVSNFLETLRRLGIVQ